MVAGAVGEPARAVITGTGGLGFEVAKALLASGRRVVVAGRNPEKGGIAVASLRSMVAGADVDFKLLDLASLKSVRAFCDTLLRGEEPLDILVNNAGIMSPPRRRETEDGFELQFGVNHLGHFALTAGLLPLLRQARAARVVSVTSLAMRYGAINFDDLQSESRYRAGAAYCQSKLAQAMFARQLQRESDTAGWGLKSLAAHPGFASTNLFASDTGRTSIMSVVSRHLIAPLIGQSAADGARPIIHAATAPDVAGGELFGPSGFLEMRGAPKRCAYAKAVDDPEQTRRLWDLSCRLTNASCPSA
jgi:NAD(P)-dependent dehydrogenase (short-subunit alcohol dehydrogenase family)